jgi:SH3-like domain-containing protein
MPSTLTRLLFAVALLAGVLVPTADALAQRMVSVDRPEINMRDGPGTQHTALWSLVRGYPLEVLGRKGDWYRVRDFERDTGWVYRPLTSTKKPHHIVKSKVANVRSGPGTRYRVIGKAVYGEVLRTLEKRDGWVKVSQSGGSSGWVARRLLWGW